MAEEHTAATIRDRFMAEQNYIEQYMAFLVSRSHIGDRQIINLNIILRRHGLPTIRYRSLSEMMGSFPSISHAQLQDVVRTIDALTPDVETALIAGRALLAATPSGSIPEAHPGLNDTAVAIVKLVEKTLLISEPLSAGAVAKVEAHIREERSFYWSRLMTQYPNTFLTFPHNLVEDVIRTAIHFWLDERVEELATVLNEFGDLRVMVRAASPDAEINSFRQGFILLMTAFDAAIFDLVRISLSRKFFALAGAFGKQDKVSVSDIAEAGSFDALRDQLIEEQLKKRYIKDLLGLLQKEWGVVCVDPSGGQKFERLIELVLRRNLHVHNRGVVDSRYAGDMNLDGLKLGNVAVIDRPYWEMANTLCKDCVERVAAWAGA
jgi:hypothetical protein